MTPAGRRCAMLEVAVPIVYSSATLDHYPVRTLDHYPVRTLATRVTEDTPGAVPNGARWWAYSSCLVAPDLPAERMIAICRQIGISAALSWLASKWTGRHAWGSR